jgi:2,4'-dihydroxyacetophenone dioxygenase
MPVQTFNFFSSGLTPEQRHFHDYTVDTDLDDDRLWVPFAPGSFFQPCQFNTTSGGFIVLLKAMPGAQIPPHYHPNSVVGYTLRGSWRYLEHDWVAKAGTFIYEPAGEAHTLIVDEDATEPMITLFFVTGGFIYLNNAKDGEMIAYDDGFTILEIARDHYRKIGMDTTFLDRMVR